MVIFASEISAVVALERLSMCKASRGINSLIMICYYYSSKAEILFYWTDEQSRC